MVGTTTSTQASKAAGRLPTSRQATLISFSPASLPVFRLAVKRRGGEEALVRRSGGLVENRGTKANQQRATALYLHRLPGIRPGPCPRCTQIPTYHGCATRHGRCADARTGYPLLLNTIDCAARVADLTRPHGGARLGRGSCWEVCTWHIHGTSSITYIHSSLR